MRSREAIQKDGTVKNDLIIEVLLDNRDLLAEIRDLLTSQKGTFQNILEEMQRVEVVESQPEIKVEESPPQPEVKKKRTWKWRKKDGKVRK